MGLPSLNQYMKESYEKRQGTWQDTLDTSVGRDTGQQETARGIRKYEIVQDIMTQDSRALPIGYRLNIIVLPLGLVAVVDDLL